MTSIPFFQVDAFAPAPLTGNPAAVMPLEHWLDDAILQAIAAENNLSETAFTVPSEREDADFDLRWFTPASEVDLCGHATIATGHILVTGQPLRFSTRSGILVVARRGDLLELDLPAAKLTEGREPALCAALGLADQPVWFAEGCNDAAIVEVAGRGRGSRDRAGHGGTGPRPADGGRHRLRSRARRSPAASSSPTSASTRTRSPARPMRALVPYWAQKLGRTDFTALQASKRSGVLDCRLDGDRVVLGGQCRHGDRRPVPAVSLLAFLALAAATPQADRAAILDSIHRMEGAWNRGDFRGYMAGFENPNVVFVGRQVPGRLAGHARPLCRRIRRFGGAPRHAPLLQYEDRHPVSERGDAGRSVQAGARTARDRRREHAAVPQNQRPLAHHHEPRLRL